MGLEFSEIKAEDFITFSRDTPDYVKLEQALIELGGNGVNGATFKMNILNAAGWNYGKLISYGAHPEVAASAFNIIRNAIDGIENKESLIENIEKATQGKLH